MSNFICMMLMLAATLGQPEAPGQFGIYLADDPRGAEQLLSMDINEIKLEEEPFISTEDIVTYDLPTHGINLTPWAFNRLKNLDAGSTFVVCVGEERIYMGAIWLDIWSQSYPGVVILKHDYWTEQEVYPDEFITVNLNLGYPYEGFFEGEDKRSDPRIIRALKDAALLLE